MRKSSSSAAAKTACRSSSATWTPQRRARGARRRAGPTRRPRRARPLPARRCRWRKRPLPDWRPRPKRYHLSFRALRLPRPPRRRAPGGRSVYPASRPIFSKSCVRRSRRPRLAQGSPPVSKLSGRQRLAAHKGVSLVARAVSPTRAATSTRFAAATILNPIADTASTSIETVRHGSNCSRETIANRAARMRCVMLIRTIYFEQANIIAAVVCSLIVAGLLKGIIGVGMPVVALPLLSLFIDIKSAAMLLSMPLIFSNLPQALEGGKTGRCLMQLMPVILGMIPGLFLGVRVLLALDANVAKIIAGLVLMGVGGVTLLAPKLQLQSRLVLPTGITVGFFGGILGGIAAMPGPLVFIFLLAKGLRGKAFTKEASLYLVVSAALLAILLTASRQFGWLDVSVSTAAILPVVLGMYVGQHMRDKIAPETFKKLVLIAVIAAGADLLRHGFLS